MYGYDGVNTSSKSHVFNPTTVEEESNFSTMTRIKRK